MKVSKIRLGILACSLMLSSVAAQVISFTPSTGTQHNSSKSIRDTRWREIAKNRSDMVNKLLNGYDKRIRPFTGELPLEVRVDMLVTNIWAIEEAKMDFTLDIYLRQYWIDPRLTFPPLTAGFDSGDPITLNRQTIDQIWIPSTYFFNAKRAYFHDVTTDNYLLQIQPNGSVFYSVRLTVNVACKLNLRMFPHDVQTCTVMLESYGYQAKDVYYRWNSREASSDVVYIADDVEMPQFLVAGVTLGEKTNIYNIGNHSALTANFTFNRRLGYYLIQTYVPSMLTVIISWFSFWISPDSPPARVGLGITTVLTMITISNSARAPLPKVSYTKAIDWFLLMCLVFVFGALMEYAVVNFYSFKVAKRRRNKTSRSREGLSRLQRSRECSEYEALDTAVHEVGENGSIVQSASPEQQRSLAVLINQKSPFCLHSSTRSYRTQAKAMSRSTAKRTHNTATGTREEETEDAPDTPYYLWDPVEASFLLTEPAYFVDKCARVLFPVTYIVLNSVYWMVYTPGEIVF